MAWARNGTSSTLASANANIEITNLNAKKFNVFLSHLFPSGTSARDLTFNANSNQVYADRYVNSSGSSTRINQTFEEVRYNSNEDTLHLIYTCSISGQDKLSILFYISNLDGVNAPNRGEYFFKFVPSPDADITQIKFNKGSFTNFDTGSNLIAIGTD